MLDLSRCRNLVEFDFGQSLEECLGTAVEPHPRPTRRSGLVGYLAGWHSCVAIHPPVEWCSPSFMLVSVAQLMLQERGWKDAPLCENVVAVHIELDEAHAHAKHRDDAREPESNDSWLTVRFTAEDVRMDARGCAQHVCETFIARQKKVLDDAFMEFLKWRVECEKHPCTPLKRAPSNRLPRPSAVLPPAFNRCLGWIDRQEAEDAVGAKPSAGRAALAQRQRSSGRARRVAGQ